MALSICESPADAYLKANFSAFEIDDEVLTNLREYALANSLYWALAEGHACEMSARRNAMDVCYLPVAIPLPKY
jgi:F0F1-type ATP synthase gamma subunit